MYCSEKVCGNESEINPDDDETDGKWYIFNIFSLIN